MIVPISPPTNPSTNPPTAKCIDPSNDPSIDAPINQPTQCLQDAYASLGEECAQFTYAASVCDFKAIRDVCPRVHSSADAAECVEMVLEQHKRGRTVPKNFLNMSHAHCADTLRALPDVENTPTFEVRHSSFKSDLLQACAKEEGL